MWNAAADLAAAVERALAGFADAVAGAAPGWLALGLVLHLLNQVLRGRGWYAIVRAACEDGPGLRRRDAIAAWVAGAGAGGVASARAGDALRVLLLARRLPGAGCPVVAGTLVAEGAGELAGGAALVAVALALGVGPELGASTTSVALVLAVAVAFAGAAAAAARVPRLRAIAMGMGRGCAPLRAPGAYARGVLPWQLASRLCRVAALACFLAAFALPATPAAVLLVVFAQGSGRLLPLAPASLGAGAAMLAATFGTVTGTAVPAERLAAFFVGTSTLLTLVGATLTTTICLRTVRWRGLADALGTARRSPAGA
jgi:Lysylphosphatidylglycerol synthase TM region